MSTYLLLGSQTPGADHDRGRDDMYGVIGKVIAEEGSRDELAAILLDGIGGMPGCLSYVVAADSEDPDALWVTEVWDSEESHRSSLSLPAVEEAIEKGRPLISRFGERHVTAPLGGHGLERPS